MKKLILFAALFCAAFPAFARPVTGTWTNATANVDSIPIPATGPESLASTRLEWSLCASPGVFGTLLGATSTPATTPGAQQSSTTPNLPAGVYCFRAQHFLTDGTSSTFTNTVTVTIQTPRPRAPQGLTVN